MIRYDYIYRLQDIHFMQQLVRENESIESYIKRLEEEIKDMKKRQLALYEKSKELILKEYDYSIQLIRRERDKITYEVIYMKSVPGVQPSSYNGTSEVMEQYKFTGKERNKAIELANKLSKEYRCKLNKNF